MYDGYFSMGSNEIANTARVFAYSNALMPSAALRALVGDVPSIPTLLGDAAYTTPEEDRAPWFDEDVPESAGFAGFLVTSASGLDDSTFTAQTVEGLFDGGFTLEGREATREVRLAGVLLGVDELAVNAGLTWLRSALDGERCSVHDAICRQMDLRFLAAKPNLDGNEPDLEVERLRFIRYLHDTRVTVKPIVRSRRDIGGCGHIAEVEFAIVANDPVVLTLAQPAGLAGPSSEVAFNEPITSLTNLCPHPSFSEWDGLVTVYRNLLSNPSGEVTSANWAPYFVNDGSGTITTPVIAKAPFGRRMIRMTVDERNLSKGAAGLRVAASVTAGQTYSVGIAAIRSSQRQRLRFSVEWRNASGSISSILRPDLQFIAEPGRLYNKKLENITAPATATTIWIRVHSTDGPSEVVWNLGAYLEVDGAMMVAGSTLPPYFDGDTKDDLDWVYDWAGARHESQSLQRARQPLGALPASQTFNNGAGWMALSQKLGRSGKNSIRYEWTKSQTAGASTYFGMGGSLNELAAVTPGVVYNGSIYLKAQRRSGRFRARPVLRWFDGSGNVISESLGAVANYVASSKVYHRFAHSATAPALAVRVAVLVRIGTVTGGTGADALFRADDTVVVDAAQVTQGPKLHPYFDGSLTSNTRHRFSWAGEPGQSISLRENVDPDDAVAKIILDPLLPPTPTPPRPPAIPDLALPTITEWRRQVYLISSSATTVWATAYPIITLATDSVARRRVRVTILPNPYGEENDLEYSEIAEMETSFIISYLPPRSQITIDCTLRRAWVQQADGTPVPAETLLYSTDGGPIVWPTMNWGEEHLLCVDLPAAPAGGTVPAVSELLIARRE